VKFAWVNEMKTKIAKGCACLSDLNWPIRAALLSSAVGILALVPMSAESRSPTAGAVFKTLDVKVAAGSVSSAAKIDCWPWDLDCLLQRPTGSVSDSGPSEPGERGGHDGHDGGDDGGTDDGGDDGGDDGKGPKGNNGLGNGDENSDSSDNGNGNTDSSNPGQGGGHKGGGQGNNK